MSVSQAAPRARALSTEDEPLLNDPPAAQGGLQSRCVTFAAALRMVQIGTYFYPSFYLSRISYGHTHLRRSQSACDLSHMSFTE